MSIVTWRGITTRPNLESKFWFEYLIDWERRPWVEDIEAELSRHPGLIRVQIIDTCPREELVARREELREDLKFMADDCMDFEPEYFDFPQMSGFPTWNADMSPPFNPFLLTMTAEAVFSSSSSNTAMENFEVWYNNHAFPDILTVDNYKTLIATNGNTYAEKLFVDGVEVPFVSKFA